jgi:hypothetical protein
MKVTLTPSFELTTEHAASSYGQPVLVDRGTGLAYGPANIIVPYPSWGHMLARDAVKRMAATKKLGKKEQQLVNSFVEFPGAAKK